VRQAKLFQEAVDVTGIVLTKLDGTAKGGIALAIAGELGLPVKLIGIGEALEDLRPFDAGDFARAILDM
jgi:fused signal recognition particle receptor